MVTLSGRAFKPYCSLQDATFEMERQRNRPVKYDRELVQRSVKAMQKVEQVGGCAHASVSRWQPLWCVMLPCCDSASQWLMAPCACHRAAHDLLPL